MSNLIRGFSCSKSGLLAAMLMSGVAVGLAGCGATQPQGIGAKSAALRGRAMGGQQPVAGAVIQLYAAGSGGDRYAASPQITKTIVTTGADGSFNISGEYTCPSDSVEVYLTATGGNPGLPGTVNNGALALMTALGPCGAIASLPYIELNEVTTVATVAALYPYMSGYAAVASGTSDAAQMAAAFTAVNEYADISQGMTPGPALPAGYYAQQIQINTLADAIAGCVNTAGGAANDGSACGDLFAEATPPYGGVAPTDTVGALIDILNNPAQNVTDLYKLKAKATAFQPTLTAAPASWALPIVLVSTPAFSPGSATFDTNQAIYLTDTDPNAVIYYTTDGTQPTAASTVYTDPVLVIGAETINAFAVESGIVSSGVGTGTYGISAGLLQLAAPGYSVSETAGTATLKVSRTGSLVGAASVTYATADGSAVAGTAYTASSGTLTWADQDAGSRTITVPIVDQHVTGGSQSFSVTLSGATGDGLGTQTSSTVTIADNDAVHGTIQFSAAKYRTTETGGVLTIPVTRTGGLSGAVSAQVGSVDGTALAGLDYTAVSSSVSWADGVGGTQMVQVAILNPGVVGVPKSFSLLLSGASGGAVPGSPSTALVRVFDQPGTGTTWYVDAVHGSDGNNGKSLPQAFATFQPAVAAAQAGDTVLAEDGNYNNPYGATLYLNNGGSAAGGYIVYEPAPGANPVIQLGIYSYGAVQVVPGAAYVIVEGFTVTGSNDKLTFAGAQSAEGPAGYEDQQNIVYNGSCISVNGNTNTTQQTGAVQPNHVLILDNTASYCGSGIGSGAADYVTISGNTIFDNAWYTIYGASAISMLGSYDTNPGDTSYRMFITDNVIYGNEEFIPWISQGVITDGEAIIMDSNLNAQYVGAGLNYPAYGGRFLIANNVIYNDGSSAVEVFESAHVDVVNNTTFNDNLNQNSEAGRGELSISGGSSDVNVFNNIFYSSTDGIARAVSLFEDCPTCHIDYNLYYGGAANFYSSPDNGNGPHDLFADPLYVSAPLLTINGDDTPLPTDQLNAPTGYNLQLLPGSPAIGAGTATFNGYAAPAVDIVGNPRPSANGYTLGAYSQ
jgi:hypothetical protein